MKIEDVERIYSAIQRLVSPATDRVKVIKHFEADALIYIPSPQISKWVSVKDVRWTAPRCLPDVTALAPVYPSLRKLFLDILTIRSADASDVVNRLLACADKSEHVDQIVEILTYLSQQLDGEANGKAAIDRLCSAHACIMPVYLPNQEVELRKVTDKSWFYPDTTRLKALFENVVPLMRADFVHSTQAAKLMQKLGVAERKLSKHVVEETVVIGEGQTQADLTQSLQSKAKYIARIAGKARRKECLDQLGSVQVYSASRLVLKRHVVVGSRKIYGKDDVGTLSTEMSAGKLVVYVTQDIARKRAVFIKQLGEWLVDVFSIAAERKSILQDILSYEDPEDIENMLEEQELMLDDFVPIASSTDDSMTATEEEELLPLTPNLTMTAASDTGSSSCESMVSSSPSPFLASQTKPTIQTLAPGNKINGRGVRPMARPVATAKAVRQIILTNSNASIPRSVASVRDLSIDANDFANTFNTDILQPARAATVVRNGIAKEAVLSNGSLLRATNGGMLETVEDEDPEQLAIGSYGEHFVYQLLSNKFDAQPSCWTSAARAQHGLSVFNHFEGDFSDFTIDDRAVNASIINWLRDAGCVGLPSLMGKEITFHIEVKATTGGRDEPFSFSANQYDQALNWRRSDTDVYILFRVYDLYNQPKVWPIVDPVAMQQSGELRFNPVGGYTVEPA